MNKYLEKIAGLTPRYVRRAASNVIGAIRDAKGTGTRAVKANAAKWDAATTKHNVKVKDVEIAINKDLGKTRGISDADNVYVGNSEAAKFRAQKDAESAATRAQRTQRAAELAKKSARGAFIRTGVGAATTATVATGAAIAHKKDA